MRLRSHAGDRNYPVVYFREALSLQSEAFDEALSLRLRVLVRVRCCYGRICEGLTL